MQIEEQLFDLKQRIDSAEKEENQLEGQLHHLYAQLKEEHSCKDLRQGEKKLEKLREALEELHEQIREQVAHIEETYPWE